jgi:chromate transport protein ChrA
MKFDIYTIFGTGTSVGAIVATIMGFIPPIAAMIAIVWYVIQICESDTVKRWFAYRRTRKIARLRAQVLMLEAQSKSRLPGPEDN